MKLTTFALFAAFTTAVMAAPTPEAHRGDGQRGNGRHGHKYGGNRKYGHQHKQPHADAPATTDEWDEDEPCVGGTGGPAVAAVAGSSSSAISSSSAVVSSSASTAAPASSSSSSSETPEPTPSSTWTPQPEPTPPGKEEPKQEEPKYEEPKQEENKTSNGGRHGQITTYSVTNPAENHGHEAGTVACYTLNRKFSNSDYIAAVRTGEFHLGLCGKSINVCGKNGCVDVQIVDSCAGGGCKDLDLSPSAFMAVTGDHTGVYDVTIQGY
jgi:hypothetical protein